MLSVLPLSIINCQKLWPVEVNHVIRVALYPDLCFPCDVVNMFLKFMEIREGTDVNSFSFTLLQRFLKLYLNVAEKV